MGEDVVPPGAGQAALAERARAVGVSGAGGRLPDRHDDHLVDLIHRAITIDKTASAASVDVGGEVTFTYVVTNTGDTTLFDIKVVDDVLGAIGTIDELAAGASETLTATQAVTGDTPLVNVGTATGTDVLGLEVSDDDDATIAIVAPTIIEKPPVVAGVHWLGRSPIGTKIAPKRRTGAAAVRLCAVSAGTIDSSSGSASVAPRPRRTVRRGKCRLVAIIA